MKKYIALALALLLVLTACSTTQTENQDTSTTTTPQIITLPLSERTFSLGVTDIVPQGYPRSSQEDWKNLYTNLSSYGEILGVYADWNDTQKDGIPEKIRNAATIANQTGTELLVGLTFDDAEDKYYFIDNGAAYRTTALQIAREYHPAYMTLGVEVNDYYNKTPEGFEIFAKQYQSVYDAIKKESPSTKVFVTFQLETTQGGRKILGEENTPQWELLDKFGNKLDVVGFTSYPFFTYPNPQDIPTDYYTSISKHTTKPIVFTQIGWHSREEFDNTFARLNDTPYASSEQEQADFLITFLDQTQVLNKEAVIWMHIHDLRGEGNILNFVGLKNNNGRPKIVDAYWKEVEQLPQVN